MQIKEMFRKEIDRELQGVIVVGQGAETNVAQELEEYVVTRELVAEAKVALETLEKQDVYKRQGVDELTDADIRVFFKDKQAQSEKVAAFQDYTLHRLGAAYKTQLYEAGMLDGNKGSSRKILRPILDIALERWLQDNGYAIMVNALTGVR